MALRASEQPIGPFGGPFGITSTHPGGARRLWAQQIAAGWGPGPLPRMTRVTETPLVSASNPPEPPPAEQAVAEESRPHRTWLWFGPIVVALAVLVGLVWISGGFEQRTDIQTKVTPGTTVSTGPYVFTFDNATVQKKKGYDDQLTWEVVVHGSGRVTGNEALAPSTLSWFAVAQEPVSRQVVEPESQNFGPADRSYSGGSFFTPGLAPIPYRLTFQYPIAIEQPKTVDLAVWVLEQRDTSLLQTGELTWARSNSYYRYGAFPMKRLADDLD